MTKSNLSELTRETFLRGMTYFAETDSTNTQAFALITSGSGLETPHLVYAESQTAGRGRGSNRWWSQAGSLTFSVIVDCAALGLTIDQQIKLPLLTGLAILRTGQSVIPSSACSPSSPSSSSQPFRAQTDFTLKWPNDVYLNGRKLAGILTEVPSRSPQRSEPVGVQPLGADQASRYAVIGVGLNVNNRFADAPEDLIATGISLSDVTGQTHSRLQILATFLKHLDALIQSLISGAPVLDEWPAFCLLTGKQVTLQTGVTAVAGTCRGIDASGALILETNHGPQRFLGGIVKSWS